jgi:putative heme iron utilization protein
MIGEPFSVNGKYDRISQRQTHFPYFRQAAGAPSLRYSPVRGSFTYSSYRSGAFCSAAQLDASAPVRLTYRMRGTEPEDHPVRIARRLLRREQRGTLATSMCGAPYASLVLVAADLDASPLLLLSDLAQHSRNIAFDPRVSLLFDGTAGYRDPLTGPRLAVIGQARAVEDPGRLARFTTHHPTSAVYSGFADFRLYRVAVERGHLVAGFGRIHWIDGRDLLFTADAATLAAAEPEILTHMNEHHNDAIADCARGLLGRAGADWRMTGIDPEGADLQRDGETARLDFPAPVLTPDAARAALVELAQKARK